MGLGVPYLLLPVTFLIDSGTLAYKHLKKENPKDVENSGDIDPYKLSASAIVPAYNEADSIETVVHSLFNQKFELKNVVVVDDCSTDGTGEICQKIQREFPDKFIYLKREERSGKASNLNYAVQELDGVLGDICYVNDGDSISTETCVERLIGNFTSDDIAAVTAYGYVKPPKSFSAKILHYGETWNNQTFRFKKRAQSYRNAIFVVCGSNTAYKKDVLKKIPFPERTKTEDTDHTWLLEENGYRIVHEEKAQAYSYDLENFSSIFRQFFRWYSGTFQCMYVHGKKLLKSKRMLLSTMVPSLVESLPYAAALVTLPAFAFISRDYVQGFLLGDFLLTVIPTAFLHRRSLLHLPEIYAFKYLGSIAWLGAGIKTTFEKLTGREYKWSNRWERIKSKNNPKLKEDLEKIKQLETEQGILDSQTISGNIAMEKDNKWKSLEGELT
jgi:cellulose synthase/poly-beta-1,6-N-acetylglucosamine synthase-like glycosyltransferase